MPCEDSCAVNVVALTKVAGLATLLNRTWLPGEKPLPVSVRVTALVPCMATMGLMDSSATGGIVTVTVAEPDFDVSALLVAVTVTEPEVGTVLGAV